VSAVPGRVGCVGAVKTNPATAAYIRVENLGGFRLRAGDRPSSTLTVLKLVADGAIVLAIGLTWSEESAAELEAKCNFRARRKVRIGGEMRGRAEGEQ